MFIGIDHDCRLTERLRSRHFADTLFLYNCCSLSVYKYVLATQ